MNQPAISVTQKTTELTFGQAVEFLKDGRPVQRKEWHESWKFIFRQVPSHINKDIVPKMQSLPEAVKNLLSVREGISYCDQIAMMDERGLIVGYSASCSDILAEDWQECTKFPISNTHIGG